MDNLEIIKKKIEEIQAKNVFSNDMKSFVTLVLKVVVDAKNNFETISKENQATMQKALDFITNEYQKTLSNVTQEANSIKTAKADMSKELTQAVSNMRKMCEDMMMSKPEDGQDGADADEQKIIQEVLSQIPQPKELILDDRKKIVEKINSGGKEKINATEITGLPEFTREVVREVGGNFVETPLKAGANVTITKDAQGANVISASASSGGQVNTVVAGTGISVNSTDPINPVITNSAPDQTVAFSGGTNVTIGGTYPNFVITDNSQVSGSYLTDAPSDGTTYGRKNGAWSAVVGGGSGITRSVNSISADTTAGATAVTDYVYFITGTTTLTLPTAVGNTNRYTIKSISGTTTVACNGVETIDGTTTIGIANEDSVDLISNNVEWKVV